MPHRFMLITTRGPQTGEASQRHAMVGELIGSS